MDKRIIISMACASVFFTPTVRAGTWTILDVPDATYTRARGIDQNRVVGQTLRWGGYIGFTYDLTTGTYTTFCRPGGPTDPYDVDGGLIAGTYIAGWDHGFTYNGATWTTLVVAGDYTRVYGIDGSRLVGNHGLDIDDTWPVDGFLYDSGIVKTLDAPGAYRTSPHGIDGTAIVGFYQQFVNGAPTNPIGFVYDISSGQYASLAVPGASKTYAYGIDAGHIVGSYFDGTTKGFLYDGTTWTTLVAPGAIQTEAWGIDGNKIVGSFVDGSSHEHSFLYEMDVPHVPAPGAVLLGVLGLSTAGWRLKRRDV